MRTLFIVLVVGCGSKTGLVVDIDDTSVDVRSDATGDVPLAPCEPRVPEVVLEQRATPRAEDGDRLWLSDLEGFGVGWVELGSSRVSVVREDDFAVTDLVARDGMAWWTFAGARDFGGALIRAEGRRDRTLDAGLFWPGGLHLDADALFYAEYTNSGSIRDEMLGRILRITTRGRDRRVLAERLGVPTDTALTGEHVYWIDSRRGHIARVSKDGGPVEIVREVSASELIGQGEFVYAVVRRGRDVAALVRFDDVGGEEEIAQLPANEARGVAMWEDVVFIQLWNADGRVGNSLGWVRDGIYREFAFGAANPVVGRRHLYFTSNAAFVDARVERVCLDVF